MKLLPSFLQATGFEYRHRYVIHGVIYTLGLAAPWQLPVWGFLRNGSTWFLVSDALSKPVYTNFAPTWNALCLAGLLFAAGGAWLRTWGAAYLGATTVHRGGMEGDRVLANGPYRFVRNPLYLGTLLHSAALALLMRPEAAVAVLLSLTIVQLRLIGREEPFLLREQGAAYEAYCATVPRLLPGLRAVPRVRGIWESSTSVAKAGNSYASAATSAAKAESPGAIDAISAAEAESPYEPAATSAAKAGSPYAVASISAAKAGFPYETVAIPAAKAAEAFHATRSGLGLRDGKARPNWRQGLLSEVYMLGVAVSFAVAGWTRGYAWDASLWHVVQGIVIALGLSVMARAFIPKSQF